MVDEVAPILTVENLAVSFRSDEGLVQAVVGVDFHAHRAKTLGIVGESGSGKSVSTKAVMQLLPGNGVIEAGSRIHFRRASGEALEILELPRQSAAMRSIRGGEIAMIFQEPMASFSPVYTIGNQMSEAIRLHRQVNRREAREIGIEMLQRVGLSNPAARFTQYPHELSGGMRQRAMIALALSTRPALLIADEPTTALDVTIQAQVLELMEALQQEFGMAIIFITHDLGVIAQIADEVAVMYLGTIVERGSVDQVIRNPQHPYTQGLLAAIPDLSSIDGRLIPVGGDIPNPLERPRGCPFHTRCGQKIVGTCDRQTPGVTRLAPGHSVRCFLAPQES